MYSVGADPASAIAAIMWAINNAGVSYCSVRSHISLNGKTLSVQYSPYHNCSCQASATAGTHMYLADACSTFEVYFPGTAEPTAHVTYQELWQWAVDGTLPERTVVEY